MAGWQKILTDENTATLTNKTIDANGTGNSISNIEVGDLASGVLDTDLSSVSASDDTLASAKAIKALTDTLSTVDEDVNVANLTARLPQITESFSIGDATDVTVTMAGGLTVTGNLDVNGTTTSINTTNLEVSDDIIILHTGEAGAYAGSAADTAIVFSGTAAGSLLNTEIGKLSYDCTGGNRFAAGNTDIGLFRLGTALSVSNDFATDANSMAVAVQLPAMQMGGLMLDDASGAAYHATGTPVAGQDGLIVWDGDDLYIYDS